MSRALKAKRIIILTLVLVSIGPRLWIGIFHGYELSRISTPDSARYVDLGWHLLTTGRFTHTPTMYLDSAGDVELFRTPGYPALLAFLVGIGLAFPAGVILFQITLDVFSILLCFWLGRSLFGVATGMIAAALLAVDVGHIVYSNMIMSDVPFAFLILLATVLIKLHVDSRKIWYDALAGMALTIATSMRPVGALSFLPFVMYLVGKKTRAKAIVLFVALSVTFPAAWMIRNYLVTGWFTLSTAFDFNLSLVLAAKTKARAEGITWLEAKEEMLAVLNSRDAGADVKGWNRVLREAGTEVMRKYPAATVKEGIFGMVQMAVSGERKYLLRLLGSERGSDTVPAIGEGKRDLGSMLGYLLRVRRGEAFVVVLQIIFNTIAWVLSAIGLYRLKTERRKAELAFFSTLIVYFFGTSLVAPDARMRMPISFIVCLMTSYAVTAARARCLGTWLPLRVGGS